MGPWALQPTLNEPFEDYLAARVAAHPELSGKRLPSEIGETGYAGGSTRLTDFLREGRPPRRPVFERRYETPPGRAKSASPSYSNMSLQ
jgi:transposase